MKKITSVVVAMLLVAGAVSGVWASKPQTGDAAQIIVKPNAGQALQILKAGNVRFFAGKSAHANSDLTPANLASKSNQGDYTYATILSCFDLRVPVERIFDVDVMDLFVVRVTGNVVDSDEIVSIEYGLGHVDTPLLVVLGHSQSSEEKLNSGLRRDARIPFGSEENIWQGIADLFLRSPPTRAQVKSGKVKVVGAIYDVTSGSVNWLPEVKVTAILAMVEKSLKKESAISVNEGHEVEKRHYL